MAFNPNPKDSRNCPVCGGELKMGMLSCRECQFRAQRPNPPKELSASTAVHRADTDTVEAVTPESPHTQARMHNTQANSHSTSATNQPSVTTEPGGATSPTSQAQKPRSGSRQTLLKAAGLSLMVLLGTFGVVHATGVLSGHQPGPALERHAAEWVVDHFGVVEVRTEDGTIRRFVAREHLPAEPFVVTDINLYDQDIHEDDLWFLPKLSALTTLDLSGTSVSWTGIEYAGQAPQLKNLYLRRVDISGGAIRLLESADQLNKLSVSGSRKFCDADVAMIVTCMPRLKMLLCSGTQVTDEGLKALAALSQLRDLQISKTKTTAAGQASLAQALPKCRIKT
ncbi:MAG: hypothetical protein R3C49_03110 [Planctomycetaceae bacterium]